MGLLDDLLGLSQPQQRAPVGQLDEQTARTMLAQKAPPRPDFNPGISGQQVIGAILKGLGGVAAPLGDVVLQSGDNERQAAVKNETYNWLLTQKDPQTGQQLAPEMAKLIVTNKDVASQYLPRILGTKTTTDAATKGAPTGYMWSDPADPQKGVMPMPGFEQKPDPVEVAVKKDELMRSRQQAKEDDTRLRGLRTTADTGREMLDKIAQLRKAREGVSYEGGYFTDARTKLGANLPDSPIPGIGIPFIPSQDEAGKAQQVQSLATDIQLGFTAKTKGAISNREMDLFGSATPGMAMSDEGAQGVIAGFEAGNLRAREKPKFFEAYRSKNGTLNGADEAWDTFVESKPILEPDAKNGFSVNKANVGAWRDFVGGDAVVSGAATPGVSGGAVLDKARAALAAGADRNAVIERLKANGIDPSGL